MSDPNRAVLGGIGSVSERACKFGCTYCFAADPTYVPQRSAHDVLNAAGALPTSAEVLMLGSDTELFQDDRAAQATLVRAARSERDVTIATKTNLSPATIRFLEGLREEMATRGNVLSVMVSLPVLRRYRELEPRVPSPQVRFRLVRRLQAAGLNPFVGIRPLLPPQLVSDQEVLEVIEATREATQGYIFGPYWFASDTFGLLGTDLPLTRRAAHWYEDGTEWWVYEDLAREERLKQAARAMGAIVWERSSEAVRAIRAIADNTASGLQPRPLVSES